MVWKLDFRATATYECIIYYQRSISSVFENKVVLKNSSFICFIPLTCGFIQKVKFRILGERSSGIYYHYKKYDNVLHLLCLVASWCTAVVYRSSSLRFCYSISFDTDCFCRAVTCVCLS